MLLRLTSGIAGDFIIRVIKVRKVGPKVMKCQYGGNVGYSEIIKYYISKHGEIDHFSSR